MFDPLYLIGAILAMWLATFPARYVPLAIFSRITLPQWFKEWLDDVPVAVFAAVLTQAIWPYATDGTLMPLLAPLCCSVIAALLVGRLTLSLLWGSIAGMIAFVGIDWFM